ncbi:MAG: CesT family type III secretion system chaperone [Myxococcales bacterium]|nr:CesT family type III secretion system chaperone [Myxococcales bacterium]
MNADKLESYMLRMEVPNEPLGDGTWVLLPQSLRHNRILVKISDPIVLFTTPIFRVTDATPNREKLFRRLLELNEDLLHCAYGLEGDQIVLSGSQPLENLDYNEFQAIVDDISMSLDRHLDELSHWLPGSDAAKQGEE